MRNPNRIQGICDRLAKLWARVPDWRFAQLISNLVDKDPFYMEDEDFIKMLEDNMDKLMGNN